MKCRIPNKQKLSNKERRIIDDYAEERIKNEQLGMTRRIYKMFCIALNEGEGFGKDRLRRICMKVEEIAEYRKDDEVYWAHIDQRLHQLGLNFEDENYDEVDE